MITSIICALGLYCGTTPTSVAEPIISQAQEIYLQRLEDCESSGSTTVKVLDTNNKWSFGRYQYQETTFLDFGKKYGLISPSIIKAEPLIYDGKLQKRLAHRMLLAGGRGHWFNCTKPLGEYPP